MEKQLVYQARNRHSGEDIKKINVFFERVMKSFGGKTINNSYVLSDGIVTEAYGYYLFPNLGKITISLINSKHSGYNFCANFVGFEEEKEKYNNIKDYIEYALKVAGLNPVGAK